MRDRSPFAGRFHWLLLATVAAAWGAACGGSGANNTPGGDSGGTGGVIIPSGGHGGSVGDYPIGDNCRSACLHFPAAAIVDSAAGAVADADITALGADPENFSDHTMCVTEPQLSSDAGPGAMLPANWLRPRFKWAPIPDTSAYELRLTNELEANPLVVYTRATEWVMPQEIWDAVGSNIHTPITVTVRAMTPYGVAGERGSFQIAPVNAGGTMVFWATGSKEITMTASRLESFSVGSEYVAPALDLAQVQTSGILAETGTELRTPGPHRVGFTSSGQVQCIGCHVSTPDGDSVVFTDDWPWDMVTANVNPDLGAAGAIPTYVSASARVLLNMPFLGIGTMTPVHWAAGDRIMVTSRGLPRSAPFDWNHPTSAELIWIDLETTAAIPSDAASSQARNDAIIAAEGTGWGRMAITGDTRSAVTPDWSHDGTRIAYSSTLNPENGALSKSDTTAPADVYIVPYGDRAGGTAAPLQGAADPSAREYYPAFSSDDALVAFNRISTANGALYYNPDGEIWVVPSAGGTPTRLAANDPPACTNQGSPGITNSWPKWSPSTRNVGGKTYYFLIFSSARQYDGQFTLTDPWGETGPATSSQLYLASIVVDDASGEITTYPAVYLWNQNNLVENGALTQQHTFNLTPAWDEFRIPPPPPPQ
jgi:hypothetical protein